MKVKNIKIINVIFLMFIFFINSLLNLSYTIKDIELLSCIIYAEAEGESISGQLAVGTVIMNRIELETYPNTLKEVVFQKNQFAKINNNSDNQSKQSAIKILQGYRSFRINVDMFQREYKVDWYGRKPLYKIGNHYFYGKDEKQTIIMN